MRKRKPEPTWHQRRVAALRFDQRLRQFAVRKDGRTKLSAAVIADMLSRFDGDLRSASVPSRIAFTQAARQLAKRRLSINPHTPAFMVTLVPRQFAIPYSEALLFDWTDVQNWTRDLLDGYDYFGILEVSYYTAHPISGINEPIVHFHVHAIVWNATRHELDHLRRSINQAVPAMLPGRLCMRVDSLRSIERVRRKLGYILKPLMVDYRGFPLKGGQKAGWGQEKRTLRSGDAAKALRLLQGINVDDLCVAGGEGISFLEAVTLRTKRNLKREEKNRKLVLMERLGLGNRRT